MLVFLLFASLWESGIVGGDAVQLNGMTSFNARAVQSQQVKYENVREITSGFFVLNLLFGKEPRECDDVGVDFFARVCAHGGGLRR